jgi:hypothetical protein
MAGLRSTSVRSFLRRRICLGVTSTSSSSSMNSSACSSESLMGGIRASSVVLAGGAEVGQLLAAQRVDREVVVLGMDADDLAFVDLLARLDEQPAALLHRDLRVGRRWAGAIGDQHAVLALWRSPSVRGP